MQIYRISFFIIISLFLLKNGLSFDYPEVSIEEGLKDIYNVRIEDAKNKFRTYQSQYPDDVKGYFYESMAYFYEAGSTRDEITYNKYLELSDNVIERCEALLDKNENNVDALYYKGASHSYRSLILLMLNKSLLKAADNGNDGYRILKKIVKEYPEYYDAYMGLGLFKIAIGFVPEKFKWLLSLIGIDGDIKDGIRMLKVAADKAKYNKVDSRVFLAVFSIREKEEQNTESLDIMKSLTEEFPESPAFRMVYGGFLIQVFKMDEALYQLNTALALNKNSVQKEINKIIYSLSGTTYFRKNDFRNAANNFEEYFKYVLNDDKYNMMAYLLGESYEMMGRRDIALEKYKASKDRYIEDRDGEGEKLFYRYSLERIAAPINELDSLTIIAANEREQGYFNESLNTFYTIAENNRFEKYYDDDLRLRYFYELGILYSFRKENDKAIECFNKCVKLNPRSELWLIPHSYFELGKIYLRAGDKEMSEKMFDKIYEFKDYDFRSFLEMRMRNFIDK